MYKLLQEFMQPTNDIVKNDPLVDIVFGFLEHGVDPNTWSNVGFYGLDYIQQLQHAEANKEPQAFQYNLEEVLKGVIESGMHEMLETYLPKAKPGTKRNLLNHAAECKEYEAMHILLKHNASPFNDPRNYDPRCPFYWAIRNKDTKAVKIFMEHKVDVNVSNAMTEAIYTRDEAMIELFLNANVDVDDETMYAAAITGNAKMFEFCLQAGVDVNTTAAFEQFVKHDVEHPKSQSFESLLYKLTMIYWQDWMKPEKYEAAARMLIRAGAILEFPHPRAGSVSHRLLEIRNGGAEMLERLKAYAASLNATSRRLDDAMEID